MGIVQDALYGIRKFTLQNPRSLWNGKLILSSTIVRGINLHCLPDLRPLNPVFDDGIPVENGELVFGIMEKKTVGPSHKAV